MKVAFLDFDGVINNTRTWSFNSTHIPETNKVFMVPTYPACMERLNRLLRETDSVVVISSSWRNFACWQDLYEALKRTGFAGHVVGETPSLYNDDAWLAKNVWGKDHYESIDRGHEIEHFIDTHLNPFSWMKADGTCDVCGLGPSLAGCRGHIIEEFVVLDDCSDMVNVKPYLVHTDPEEGLDDPDVERAKHLLEQSRDFMIRKYKESVCYGP